MPDLSDSAMEVVFVNGVNEFDCFAKCVGEVTQAMRWIGCVEC